jgi:hypothetical protein
MERHISLNHGGAHGEHSKTHLPSARNSNYLPPSGTTDGHILTVDWEGPDDPENPRK